MTVVAQNGVPGDERNLSISIILTTRSISSSTPFCYVVCHILPSLYNVMLILTTCIVVELLGH